MKTLEDIERTLRQHKSALHEKYGVTEMGVFGSYVRGEQSENSDVDILVTLERPVSLLTFVEMGHHLEDLLGLKVDLVLKKTLKPYIGRRILEEVQYV
jgi:predicted nucleotidyltransferase